MQHGGLTGLKEETRRRPVAGGQRRHYGPAEAIFHEGDPATGKHVLVAGRVSIEVTTPRGEKAVFTVLGPDALLGEMALLTENPVRSATARALEAVQTLALAADRMALLRRTHPTMDQFLVSRLAQCVKQQDARLLEALYMPVEKRVLRRLLALGRLYGDGEPETVVPRQEMPADLARAPGRLPTRSCGAPRRRGS